MIGRITIVAGLILVSSCVTSSSQLRKAAAVSPNYSLGIGVGDTYGIWFSSIIGDGVSMPYDTSWTLVMKDPTRFAISDGILIFRDANGRTVFIGRTADNSGVWKRAKSEERYWRLRKELAIPEDLALRDIYPNR